MVWKLNKNKVVERRIIGNFYFIDKKSYIIYEKVILKDGSIEYDLKIKEDLLKSAFFNIDFSKSRYEENISFLDTLSVEGLEYLIVNNNTMDTLMQEYILKKLSVLLSDETYIGSLVQKFVQNQEIDSSDFIFKTIDKYSLFWMYVTNNKFMSTEKISKLINKVDILFVEYFYKYVSSQEMQEVVNGKWLQDIKRTKEFLPSDFLENAKNKAIYKIKEEIKLLLGNKKGINSLIEVMDVEYEKFPISKKILIEEDMKKLMKECKVIDNEIDIRNSYIEKINNYFITI